MKKNSKNRKKSIKKKNRKKSHFDIFEKKSHFEKRKKKNVPELKIVDLPIHELCTTQNDLQNRIHQSS